MIGESIPTVAPISSPSDPDGVLAFWFLTGGAWACEPPTGDPLQENCRKALDELLASAVAGGVVPQADCHELLECLKADPNGTRALALAALIAPYVPGDVVARVTDKYLVELAQVIDEPLHPKFVAAGEALNRITESEGAEAIQKDEHAHLFVELLTYAPETFQHSMRAKANEMGLVPRATHVNEIGQPVFSVEQIAEHHGVSVAEVLAFIGQYDGTGDDIEAGPVFQLQ